jgi:hypothetical protein
MIKYYGMLYAKMGRKYIPTGRTAADWDLMESAIKPQNSIVCRLANAYLIAAAPELLAALKAMMNRYGDKSEHPFCDASISARAAISKAEGRA